MKRKIYSIFSLLLFLLILFSCSKNKNIEKLTPIEITNNLLVNEQLPINILSNALEWPEEIILGIDLGLIELNEEGKEKLENIFEDYSNEDFDDFVKDNNKKNWSNFVKKDWIKSETTKISKSKLNEIKDRQFKSNEIIQNKLNNFIPLYIEKQTEELSRYQFSFFSIGFWKNLGQITWIHTKSTFFGKFSNKDISYIDPVYRITLQQKWEGIYNSYFSIKKADNEIISIVKNHQALLVLKLNYISKLKKINTDNQTYIFLKKFKMKQKNIINIKPIISQFNLTLVDNFGLLFFELILGLFTFAFVRYILIKFFYAEELKINNEINNLFLNFLKTPTTPIIGGLALFGGIVNGLFIEHKINKFEKRAVPIANNLKTFLGLVLLAISFWYFPTKQIKIENEINRNFETSFISNLDKTSILDDLNLNTELFFSSI